MLTTAVKVSVFVCLVSWVEHNWDSEACKRESMRVESILQVIADQPVLDTRQDDDEIVQVSTKSVRLRWWALWD